jgi:Xaa-Pro aminopeptidase
VGADVAYPVSELGERLPKLLANVDALHYCLGIDPGFDRVVCDALASLRRLERRGHCPPRAVVDPRAVLHEMRLHKRPDELDKLRRAIAITVEAHVEAMKLAAPGRGEHELEALLNYVFRKRGGDGWGYPPIVGAGVNATTLHYVDNDCALADGDLVLIDAGCEFGGYTADITRTFPANGAFTEPQRRVYQVVLDVQKSAIEMTRPGVTLDDIHDHCVAGLTQGMIDLGLLTGDAAERIADESYKKFYMHRTSHWLGLDVHDVGAYTRSGHPRPLEPGMVITIEPGLYIAADAEGVDDALRGIGVRIEDDILVTEDGHDNLTAAAPKEIADVEAACAG